MAQNRLENNMKSRKYDIKREELLTKLKANLEKHTAEYAEAVEEYKSAAKILVAAKLKSITQELKALQGKLDEKPAQLVIDTNLFFELQPPKSHEKDYKEVIEAFSMDVKDVVELESDEFAMYVRDNWKWRDEFNLTKSSYGFAK